MKFDKYVQEFDLKDKKIDENFKKNAKGTVGLALIEIVEQGNIIKISDIKGEETEIEDLIDVRVVDDEGDEKIVKEKGIKKAYRITVDMIKVPKSAIKSKSCKNPFVQGCKE
jgi:hypothetical protein